ncbi:hypothetical protein BUALT_Bualt11G0108700 [Buddleja alternifolia]|uniref:Uncharacterized protein n=1 Tax=Buddleja alternifolia TaxID=168488 RepID=A0AAV6WVH4_9LAMI|nr:hypothetical protein BUALT_Bualt11G0108700 [Buddleja alternifolia]
MQKQNTERELKLVLKCRVKSFRVTHFIKLVPKYLSTLVNWGKKCRRSIWNTDYANITPGGHFSVITTGNGEQKKFLVGLDYLSYPPFVRLLEAAEREFGFKQQGVLAIPREAINFTSPALLGEHNRVFVLSFSGTI